MKIAVIGMGYVGVTSAACLAELGHNVIGIEKNQEKLEALNSGKVSIIEPGISDLLNKNLNKLKFTDDNDLSEQEFDVVFVAVGTPTDDAGYTDLSHINSVFETIEKSKLKAGAIIIRSTVPIGTSRELSEKYSISNLVFNPEFLREGTAIDDFFNPPKIVFGVAGSDRQLRENLIDLYSGISVEPFFVDYETAESVKYADNIFHAIKVTFTNEIARSVALKGGNPNEVMKIFASDKLLNLSPYYLKPGFAYGGSCLEKDLSSFRTQVAESLPLLEAVTKSNSQHIVSVFNKIKDTADTFIFNGLTFKESIDDLRRSPFVTLAKMLLDIGKTVYAFDRNIDVLYGESLEIRQELLGYERFWLNVNEFDGSKAVLIMCHKGLHSELLVDMSSVVLLYPNKDIAEIFV